MRDKNTSARVCTKNAGGAYARGGAYLRDTTVLFMRTLYASWCVMYFNGVKRWVGTRHVSGTVARLGCLLSKTLFLFFPSTKYRPYLQYLTSI